MGIPQNGWFIGENAIKVDDWGVPPYDGQFEAIWQLATSLMHSF